MRLLPHDRCKCHAAALPPAEGAHGPHWLVANHAELRQVRANVQLRRKRASGGALVGKEEVQSGLLQLKHVHVVLREVRDAHAWPGHPGALEGRQLALEQLQERGLARPVGAQNSDAGPRLDRHGHVLQQVPAALLLAGVGEAHALQAEQRPAAPRGRSAVEVQHHGCLGLLQLDLVARALAVEAELELLAVVQAVRAELLAGGELPAADLAGVHAVVAGACHLRLDVFDGLQHVRALELLRLEHVLALAPPRVAGLPKVGVVAGPVLQVLVGGVEEAHLLHRGVQEAPVVADDDDGHVFDRRDELLQPQHRVHGQVRLRLVQKQQVGAQEQGHCQRDAHAPAATQLRQGSPHLRVAEAQAHEHGRGPGLRC
mmetsp:Transcript_498/g.1907  ORF Transcript_498/g.1907 Transcript_498/m.1907 type:complete len:372 (-) Transcript_498:1185-2300(-)